MILQFCCHCINEFYFKSKRSFKELVKVSDKESSITLSMYLGVKWEDSRIRNINQTVEDLQVSIMLITTIHRTIPIGSNFLSTPKNGHLGPTVRGPTPDFLHIFPGCRLLFPLLVVATRCRDPPREEHQGAQGDGDDGGDDILIKDVAIERKNLY